MLLGSRPCRDLFLDDQGGDLVWATKVHHRAVPGLAGVELAQSTPLMARAPLRA